MKNNLFKKFMEFGIGSIITLLLGFISSPIITRMIDPVQNGKFGMFNTVTNLLLVIGTFGLDQSYVRFYHEENRENRGKLLRNCIAMPLMILIVLGIISLLLSNYISNYIVEEKSIKVTFLLMFNLILAITSRFTLLQIRMKQNAKLYSLLSIIQKISNLIFIILIFNVYNNNYMTLILGLLLSNFLIVLIALFFEREEWAEKGTDLKTSKKEIISYGIPLIFSMAITWIFQSIDRVSIKAFSGYEQVGLYNGAMTIIALLNAVQNTFTTFWVPVALEKFINNPKDKNFFKKVNEIVTVLMLIIAVLLISTKDILVLILGEKYRTSVFIFPYLVFMPIMYTISETTVLGINFKKKPKFHIIIATISAIVNLIGNIIIVPILGASGAAISTGVAYMIFFMLRTYFSQKLYKINFALKKFIISVVEVYILATYSSFHKFNVNILIMSLISLITIIIFYKKSIITIMKLLLRKH